MQDVRVWRHRPDCQCYRRSRRSRAFARHCFKGRPLGPIESLNLALLVGRTRGCSGRQRAWSCRCVCNHGSWFRTCPQTPSRATSRRITRRPSPSSGPQRPPPSSKSSIKSLYLPNESPSQFSNRRLRPGVCTASLLGTLDLIPHATRSACSECIRPTKVRTRRGVMSLYQQRPRGLQSIPGTSCRARIFRSGTRERPS